jgi:hypothetical protein
MSYLVMGAVVLRETGAAQTVHANLKYLQRNITRDHKNISTAKTVDIPLPKNEYHPTPGG